ncbi:MAG: RimK family alpha-L-glutamate ligase [Nanoarchaeota archaeon]|nr:RimK family alpha-L-glutamate ligase [Nanoarchaeota archaeon]MBU1005903.1 RimK family alpha-L-glutamate ligase [Nanoarchaeota archaeon]MBU1945392.1 RimK family alpha-L-glutamate ligase [Nanoarchaeota archaeon]
MKAALMSLGSESSKWTVEAMRKYFDTVDDIDIRNMEVNLSSDKSDILYNGEALEKYDCIYAKGSFRYAQTLRAITGAFYSTTYMPIKAGAFTVGHDKLLTHLFLQQNKIPMPTTYLTSSPSAAKKILEQVNYPIIFKFPSGTGGKGVMYAESFAAASSLMDALETLRQSFIIQEYIETGGEDIRVIVVGNKVVASMKRKAVVGEKRANIHAGGEGKVFLADARIQKIAVEAAKAIGAEICAVDILESVKGPVVIEVNLSPGLQGITKTTGIDVADKIAKYLYEKTKELKESGTKKGAGEIMKEINLEKSAKEQHIIVNLDLRGERILLPKLVTNISKFAEKDEVVIKASKGKLNIEKV